MKYRLFDTRTGKLEEPITNFSFEKLNNVLICSFEAKDSSLNSYSNKNNDDLYLGDVVELFLDLGSDFYYEFEVAPNNATFVAKIVNSKPVFIDSSFFESEVKIIDKDYYVQMKIDLSNLDKYEEIKINAFRIETKGIKSELILQALSPTLCNTFHVRDKFVKI